LKDGVLIFSELCGKYEKKRLALSDSGNAEFHSLYYTIVGIFMGPGSPYNDPIKYPFSDNNANFKNLVELMSDCDHVKL
jgi:hypothetical protein